MEEAPLPAHQPDRSPRFRRFSSWVSRVGALRATLLATALSSLSSLLLTWLSLRFVGGGDMGHAFWISILVPIPLALAFGGVNFFLVAALEKAWGTANQLATVDQLTGLSNRHQFMPAAEREIGLARRHGQPMALLVLDVDHFKSINDRHGHLTGDQVLVEVANRCRQALRKTDLLARWGGEEFIVLLPNTSIKQVRQSAERVREAVSASAQLAIGGQPVLVTVSVGAAWAPAGRLVSLDALIQLADAALYRAKHTGRDRISVSGDDQQNADKLVGAAKMSAWS